jgi:hypothetical protein
MTILNVPWARPRLGKEPVMMVPTMFSLKASSTMGMVPTGGQVSFSLLQGTFVAVKPSTLEPFDDTENSTVPPPEWVPV